MSGVIKVVEVGCGSSLVVVVLVFSGFEKGGGDFKVRQGEVALRVVVREGKCRIFETRPFAI